ncbi:MAG: flippase-like domain-containing protein [Bacteroidetes bacterium]|nr:flippase-like domain-containing protein [Bacteroidota bacterium]
MNPKKLRTIFFVLLKLVFAACVVWVCILPFLPNEKFRLFLNDDVIRLDNISLPALLLIVLFSILNFVFESIKWQMIGGLVEEFSFKTALKGVLAGVAVSNILPWKTGEFIGKIAWLKAENKVKGSYFSVYGSMVQLFVTVLFGLIGFLFFKDFKINQYVTFKIVWTAFAFLFILALFLIIFRNKVMRVLGKMFGNKYALYFSTAKEIRLSMTLKLFFLSVLRYLSFLIPYLILIKIGDSSLSFITIGGGIAMVFLIQSIVPGFLLSDLPVKGFIHISVFYSLVSNAWVVGNAVLIVFITNQIIPSLIGAILILLKRREFK